ncbi:hypothetical protein [Pseudomonas sp.]|nr:MULTISPECIES: hypothetical protein [unclassified Pseudomonas]
MNWLHGRLGCSHQAADLARDTFMRVLLADRRRRWPVSCSNRGIFW